MEERILLDKVFCVADGVSLYSQPDKNPFLISICIKEYSDKKKSIRGTVSLSENMYGKAPLDIFIRAYNCINNLMYEAALYGIEIIDPEGYHYSARAWRNWICITNRKQAEQPLGYNSKLCQTSYEHMPERMRRNIETFGVCPVCQRELNMCTGQCTNSQCGHIARVLPNKNNGINITKPHWLTEEEESILGQEQSNWKGSPNPVVQYNDQWYFFDEVWSNLYGPFKTKKECEASLSYYAWIFLKKRDNEDK